MFYRHLTLKALLLYSAQIM